MKRKVKQEQILEAIDGNAEAFREVYFALRGSVYGFAYRMLQDQFLAENITQETFMFLVENGERFDPARGEILSFLCGIARRKIIGHFRKHGTRFEDLEDDMSKFNGKNNARSDPLNLLLSGELAQKIEQKIARLSPLDREVLILREIEELSYQEIAEVTDTNLNLVKVRLHRARKRLAKELQPYLAEEKEMSHGMY